MDNKIKVFLNLIFENIKNTIKIIIVPAKAPLEADNNRDIKLLTNKKIKINLNFILFSDIKFEIANILPIEDIGAKSIL